MKFVFKIKGRMPVRAIGRHTGYAEHGSNSVENEKVIVFLPKIYRYWKQRQNYGIKYDFNELLSHVISHEYIHVAICKIAHWDVSSKFDNIAGQISDNPFDTRTGMSLLNKKIRKNLDTIDVFDSSAHDFIKKQYIKN